MAFDDELVDVGGVERVEGLEGEVVDDEQVDAEQFAHLGVVAVVEPAGAESFEEPVAAFEVDAVAAADGGVAEGGGEEGLADTDGSHDHGVVAAVDEPQRAQLVPDGVVVGDLGGVVPAVQGHGRVEAGGAGAAVGGGGLAAGDFVGEDELEELGVAHAAGLGEGEAFGEGVEAAAELDPAQQRPQLGGDRRRGSSRHLRRRGAGDGEVAGVAGEPAGDRPCPGSDGWIVVVSRCRARACGR